MRKIKIYHVDAFTTEPFGGNAAGVVPDASGLSEAEMQKIAREMNLSETAFLTPAGSESAADFRVRYFTPASEINFCGHATIGSSWILGTEYGWTDKKENVVLETNIGLVPVAWQLEGGQLQTVTMTQAAPKTAPITHSAEHIATLLGLDPSDIDDRYPLKLGNTGNWHLLVPVKTRHAIDNARPQFEALHDLNREYDAVTTHLFTFDTQDDQYDIYTRDFAPAVGIPEDPVTGSANGALAGYLYLEGIVEHGKEHHMTFGQGHIMGRPGTLHITILPGESAPVVQVGGSAVSTIEGMLKLRD
ncbi:MAG: PhzF family phenazine biosynthesis protein [Tumebacillaceae bacterium]